MKRKAFLILVSSALLIGTGLTACTESDSSSTPTEVNALTDEMLSQAGKGYSSENLVKVDYNITGQRGDEPPILCGR